MNIEELKKRRGTLFSKRAMWKKQGKDISSLEAELADIQQQIRDYKEEKPISVKKPASSVIESPVDYVNSCLKRFGWKNGLHFGPQGCEPMSIERISIEDDLDNSQIILHFTLQYKTKRHKIVNKVNWVFPYEKLKFLPNDIHNVYVGLAKQRVFFDKKFRSDKFEKLGYEERGWKIIK